MRLGIVFFTILQCACAVRIINWDTTPISDLSSPTPIHIIGEGLILLNGSISAPSIIIHGSNVVLMGSMVAIQQQSGLGGNILIQASSVKVASTALISTSAPRGDGSINIEAENSITVFKGAVVSADATKSGRGGRIRTFSKYTTFYGTATANAGPESMGDGGFLEISGDSVHSHGGEYFAQASMDGVAGTVLFDPQLIEITSCSVPAALQCPGTNVYDGNLAGTDGIIDIDVADNNGFPAPPDNHNVQLHYNDVLRSLAAGVNVMLRATREIAVVQWPTICPTSTDLYCPFSGVCVAVGGCATCTGFTTATASAQGNLCTVGAPGTPSISLHAGKSVNINVAFNTLHASLDIKTNLADSTYGIDQVRLTTARGSGRSSVDILGAILTQSLSITEEDCYALPSTSVCPDGDVTITAAITTVAAGVSITWGGDVIIDAAITVPLGNIAITTNKESVLSSGTATKGSITIADGGLLDLSGANTGSISLSAAFHITLEANAVTKALDTVTTATGGSIDLQCGVGGNTGTITIARSIASETNIVIGATGTTGYSAVNNAGCSVVINGPTVAPAAEVFAAAGVIAIGGKTVTLASAQDDVFTSNAASPASSVMIVATDTITFDVTAEYTVEAVTGDIRVSTTSTSGQVVLKGDDGDDLTFKSTAAGGDIYIRTNKITHAAVAKKINIIFSTTATGDVALVDTDETSATKLLAIDMNGDITATGVNAFTIPPGTHKVRNFVVEDLNIEIRGAGPTVGTLGITASGDITLTGAIDGCVNQASVGGACTGATKQALTLTATGTSTFNGVTGWGDISTLTVAGAACVFGDIASGVDVLVFSHSGSCTSQASASSTVVVPSITVDGKLVVTLTRTLTLSTGTVMATGSIDIKKNIECSAAGTCNLVLTTSTTATGNIIIHPGVTIGSQLNAFNLVISGTGATVAAAKFDHSTADITLWLGAGASTISITKTTIAGTANALNINFVVNSNGYLATSGLLDAHAANNGIINLKVYSTADVNGGVNDVWLITENVGATQPLLKVTLDDDDTLANTPMDNYIKLSGTTKSVAIKTLDIIKGSLCMASSGLTVTTLNLGTEEGGFGCDAGTDNFIHITDGGVMNWFSTSNQGATTNNIDLWDRLVIDGTATTTGTTTINIYNNVGASGTSGQLEIDASINLVNIYKRSTGSVITIYAYEASSNSIIWEAQKTMLKGTAAIDLVFDANTAGTAPTIVFGDTATAATLALDADNKLDHTVEFKAHGLAIYDSIGYHGGTATAATVTKIKGFKYSTLGTVAIDDAAIIVVNGNIDTTNRPITHTTNLLLVAGGNIVTDVADASSGDITATAGTVTLLAYGTTSLINVGDVTATGAIDINAKTTVEITGDVKSNTAGGNIIITSVTGTTFNAQTDATVIDTFAGNIEINGPLVILNDDNDAHTIEATGTIHFKDTVTFSGTATATSVITIQSLTAGDITFDKAVVANDADYTVVVTATDGDIIIKGDFVTAGASFITLTVTDTANALRIGANVGHVGANNHASTGDICDASIIIITGDGSLKAARINCNGNTAVPINADASGNDHDFLISSGAQGLQINADIGATQAIKNLKITTAAAAVIPGTITIKAVHNLELESTASAYYTVGTSGGGNHIFKLVTTDTAAGVLTVNADLRPAGSYDDTFKIDAAYDVVFGTTAISGGANRFRNYVWMAKRKLTYNAATAGFIADDNVGNTVTPDAFDITAMCMHSKTGAIDSVNDNAIRILITGKCTDIVACGTSCGFYSENPDPIIARLVPASFSVNTGAYIDIKLTDDEAWFKTSATGAKFIAQTGIVFNLAGDNYDLDLATQFGGTAFTHNYITLFPLAFPTFILPAPGALFNFADWDGKLRIGFNVNMQKRIVDSGWVTGSDFERKIVTDTNAQPTTTITGTSLDGTALRGMTWTNGGKDIVLGATGAMKCATPAAGCCVGIVWFPNLVAGWDWNDLYGQIGFVPHDIRPFPAYDTVAEIATNQFRFCSKTGYAAGSVYTAETRTVQFATTADVDEINVYSVCGLISSQFMLYWQDNSHVNDQIKCTAKAGSSIITVILSNLPAGTADAAVAVLSSILSQIDFRAALETRNMGTTLYGTVIVTDGASVIPIYPAAGGMKISNTPTLVGGQTTFTFMFKIPAAATTFTIAHQWRITLPANDFWWAPGTVFTVKARCTANCGGAITANTDYLIDGTIDHTGHTLEFKNDFNTNDPLLADMDITLTLPDTSSTKKITMPQNCLNFNSWLYLVSLGHESDVPGMIYLGRGSDDRCQQQSVVIFGDPHFNSFSGGYYDISGRSGGIYTIITDEHFLWNSMFVAKPHADRAAMHTYLGLTGFTVFDKKITYDPNTDNATLDGEIMDNSESRVFLTNSSSFYVKKESNLMILRAPGFRIALKRVMHTHRQRLPHFDHAVDILRDEILHPHGLLGQTAHFTKPVKAVDHQGTGVIEGKLDDYEVNNVHSVHCLFNQYGVSNKQVTAKASNPTTTWADAWFKHEIIPHGTLKADGQAVKPAQRTSTFFVTPYTDLKLKSAIPSGSKITWIKHPQFEIIAQMDSVDGYTGKTMAVSNVVVKFADGKTVSYNAANNLTVNGVALDAGETAAITKIGTQEFSATRMRVKNGGAIISVPGLDIYLRVDMIKGARLGQQTEITDSTELAKMDGLMGAVVRSGTRTVDEQTVNKNIA